MTYDMICVGGGIAGASLARSMAGDGARVLVVERESNFRDRVRGEGLHPWGVAEARALGVEAILRERCARDVPRWSRRTAGFPPGVRDLAGTTPAACGEMTFHHPEMQGAIRDAAAEAGAEVRTGTTVTGVTPGRPVEVRVRARGKSEEKLSARLVVGADGRSSRVRTWGGFAVRRDPPSVHIAGILLEGLPCGDDSVHTALDPPSGRGSFIFPIGGGRHRCYFVFDPAAGSRGLRGGEGVAGFVRGAVETGMPAEWFAGASPAGPLATFDASQCWVDHPYREGVALIGDAAATSDPSYGCGLALALRDARVLRDRLRSGGDTNDAGHAYAAEHDRYYGVVHRVEEWLRRMLYETGPAADARRARAFPRLREDPTRWPDLIGLGPETPADDLARSRFFGES